MAPETYLWHLKTLGISLYIDRFQRFKRYHNKAEYPRLNYVIFALSFGFSLFANTFDAHLNIVTITQSKLTEIGVHFVTRCMLVSMCVLKLLNIVYKRRFFEIVSKLHWCHMKVNNETLQHKKLINKTFFLFVGERI